MTTRQAIDAYIASLRARHVPLNTIKSYAHDLRHFVTAVPESLADVGIEDIQQFLELSFVRIVIAFDFILVAV